MNKTRVFDVLVVYTASVALSARSANDSLVPFSTSSGRDNYNDAYGYFLEVCDRLGLRAAFTTSADIVDVGTCNSFWTYKNKKWQRVLESCFSQLIFDKFSPLTKKKKKERALLFGSDQIHPFNNSHLAKLFFDKQATYLKLPHFSIPTIPIIDTTRRGIAKVVAVLRDLTVNHSHSNDFTQAIIVKDRFGAGGHNIFKVADNFASEIYDLVHDHDRFSFILQPYMKFDEGYSYKGRKAATDIRLIYQNGEIIQTYIRMAKADDFRCNEHQGGTLIYVDLADIPQKVLDFSGKVSRALSQHTSLFALDYIVSDRGNVYFLEGNIGPGIDWNPTLKKNERMSKSLIRSIVRELARRSEFIKLETISPLLLNPVSATPPVYLPA